MVTVETREKKTEKECEVYPAGEFFDALNRLVNERTDIKIVFVGNRDGDITYSVSFADLGISLPSLSHPIYRTHSFANFFGEILLHQNLDVFADCVMRLKNYDALVKAYRHREFGLRTKGDTLQFVCHISLVHQLLNESISAEIADDVAKTAPATVQSKRVKRCDEHEHERITTFADNDNLRLIVPKTNELRICLENAMETVLAHYNVKNKDILITDNMFSYQIEITDKTAQK